MKEIPVKSFNEKDSTVTLLLVCLNTPPAGGFDFATIRARNRIADAVEKLQPGEIIKLEDSDYSMAQEAIKATRWVVRNKELLQFGEAFGL